MKGTAIDLLHLGVINTSILFCTEMKLNFVWNVVCLSAVKSNAEVPGGQVELEARSYPRGLPYEKGHAWKWRLYISGARRGAAETVGKVRTTMS